MSQLSKEDLEYHISDIGIDKTLLLFKMSEKEANNLLYGKVYGESDRFIYREPVPEKKLIEPILTPDRIRLYKIIKQNYKVLYKCFVRDKWKVNGRGTSQEDTFHNSLLAILKGNFVYRSDKETLHMIRHGFKNQSLGEVSAIKIDKEKKIQFQDLFREMTGVQPEMDDGFLLENESFLNVLSTKQRKLVELIAAGNTAREISDLTGIDINNFSEYKKRIGIKINKFFLKNKVELTH